MEHEVFKMFKDLLAIPIGFVPPTRLESSFRGDRCYVKHACCESWRRCAGHHTLLPKLPWRA